jgi:hypothetical protein
LAALDMKDLARRGAQVRITELQSELEAIYGAFPDLRQRGITASRGRGREASEVETGGGAVRGRKRSRRRMSAAQRTAVGERMKKYWAARRTEAATKKR